MKSVFKPLLLAGIVATLGTAAFSQGPAMMGAGGPMHAGMGHDCMGKMGPGKLHARMERQAGALKAKLQLSAAQEGAWTTFTAAMKPPAGIAGQGPDRAELAKLTTPERIDKMKAMHAQHAAERNAVMDKHAEATKAFYAALTPEQQKIFDANTLQHHGRGGPMGGPREGKGPAQPKQ